LKRVSREGIRRAAGSPLVEAADHLLQDACFERRAIHHEEVRSARGLCGSLGRDLHWPLLVLDSIMGRGVVDRLSLAVDLKPESASGKILHPTTALVRCDYIQVDRFHTDLLGDGWKIALDSIRRGRSGRG
jgi:hypothetical protein